MPPSTPRTVLAGLGFAFWAPPLAWLGQLILNYALTSSHGACQPQAERAYLFVINVVAAVIVLVASRAALRTLETFRAASFRGEVRDWERFIAICGVLLVGLFLAAILFQTIALVLVPQCGP